MKRLRISRAMVTDYHVLVDAAVKASAGKRARPDISRFYADFDRNIKKVRQDLISGAAPYNHFRKFTIFDPKERVITAVCFEDRIIHHALMTFVAPAIEKSMIFHSYACRPGKGPLRSVSQVQVNIRKYPWYIKIDIEKYFERIDHDILINLLLRKFKGEFFFSLVMSILNGYSTAFGKGLPIGSLTSQHFANFYLNGLDRMILEKTFAQAYVRYMDDMVWWAEDKGMAKSILRNVRDYLETQRLLTIKDNIQIQRSLTGITFCGFRILPGSLRLTKRKKKRYTERRKYWEELYTAGRIDARQLQAAYDSVRGVVAHASVTSWMKRQLAMYPFSEM